jgi:tetratricopeptide (TPR) repeat protein
MRRPATVGAWARRHAVLANVLPLCAAVAALSLALHLRWLQIAALLLAVIGWSADSFVVARKARLESRQELHEARRTLRIMAVSDIDSPDEIGVDPPAKTPLADTTLPDYVPRTVDKDLTKALRAALAGTGQWILVVEGRSKVGKSRTLFEAVRQCADTSESPEGKLRRGFAAMWERRNRPPPLYLVAPRKADDVKALLTPGQPIPQRAVLWLDDLEVFLNDGLRLEDLRGWHKDSGPGRMVAATFGGKGTERVVGEAAPELQTVATNVLNEAKRIRMRETNEQELAPLQGQIPDIELDAVRKHGLGAYLVAGDLLQYKLENGRLLGEPECPEGKAVIHAAADWARCGRTDPITESALRALSADYLNMGEPNDERFAAGLQWAMRPVAGAIAMLQPDADGYRAYDYVVRLRGTTPDAGPPLESVWTAATEISSPEQALGVGVAAWQQYGLVNEAMDALTRAVESADDQIVANAYLNRAAIWTQIGRPWYSMSSLDELVERHDDNPALHEQVALARYNKAMLLGVIGMHDESIDGLHQFIDRYRADTHPNVRRHVAIALLDLGREYDKLGRSEEALGVSDQLIGDFGNDPEDAELVAAARHNRGTMLRKLDRLQDAVDTFQQIADSPLPRTANHVIAAAHLRKAMVLSDMGRHAQALTVLQDLIDEYDPDVAKPEGPWIATAHSQKVIVLNKLDRSAEADVALRQLIDEYGDLPQAADLIELAKGNDVPERPEPEYQFAPPWFMH